EHVRDRNGLPVPADHQVLLHQVMEGDDAVGDRIPAHAPANGGGSVRSGDPQCRPALPGQEMAGNSDLRELTALQRGQFALRVELQVAAISDIGQFIPALEYSLRAPAFQLPEA